MPLGMDNQENDKEALTARIQQLEHERDELHKDIEQLCMQQAGPGYLSVATKMHFQRIASLEQEIESLKKKLATCLRENSNLQEELSEAYRIKSQLADLHGTEVKKNTEMEKQLKFFQASVAAAFAERDHSILEAEKAKEKEELMSQQLNDSKRRLDELDFEYLELKKLNDKLHSDLAKKEELTETFKEVVNKFYGIRQQSSESSEDICWNDKCACLLQDPAEMWTFSDASTSRYISALEEELDNIRRSMDNLQNKLHVGLEIENHLKKNLRDLEKKNVAMEEMVKNAVARLRHYHSKYKAHVIDLLGEEKLHIKSIINIVEEKFGQFDAVGEQRLIPQGGEKLDDNECRDVHVTNDANYELVFENSSGLPESTADGKGSVADTLAQALREKVEALLLLSQQEERHLLERNVNAALQKKIEEFQRNLIQVTNEKVRALMELAQLKQEYHQLQESKKPKLGHEIGQGRALDTAEQGNASHDRYGRLKNLLKKSYMRRWVGTPVYSGNEGNTSQYNEGNFLSRSSNSGIDLARLKIENATLKESMENMEHLTSSIDRLRVSLLKAKESITSEDSISSILKSLDDITYEAKLIKTALCGSLPVSWSTEAGFGLSDTSIVDNTGSARMDSCEKVDSISAAGYEMVELLILASQILKDSITKKGS